MILGVILLTLWASRSAFYRSKSFWANSISPGWFATLTMIIAAPHVELLWKFRVLVDPHNDRTIFYQISDQCLSLYIDMGLSLAKQGEESRVALVDFSLEGSQRAEFRQVVYKARKHGATFKVVPRAMLGVHLADVMQRIGSVAAG